MTSRDKGGHRYNRLTWMWSRKECATNHHFTEVHRPEAAPATPPHHTQDARQLPLLEEAAPQQPLLDLTLRRDTQGDSISCIAILWALWVGNPGQDPIPCHLIRPLFLPTTLISLLVVPIRWAEPVASPLHMGT